ncbi:hypothetical protein ACVITL_004811 [Rhizobium pisi]
MPRSATCIGWSRFPTCKRKCMNGPALRITSRMFAPATSRKMSLPCSLVYWPMRRTSAQSEWRAHPRGSALTRLGGCVHSMPDQRPTARRKRASPMPTPSIRIPSFGAMAQRHRQMANSSARATELQSAETSICITATNPDRYSIAPVRSIRLLQHFAYQSDRERGGLCARWAL